MNSNSFSFKTHCTAQLNLIKANHFRNLMCLTILSFLVTFSITAQTWDWQNPLPQGSNLFDVCFTDQNTGYSVGMDGTILKTTDAGITWQTQNSGTFKTLGGVDFPSGEIGYVVGSEFTLLKTTNAGTTWETLPMDISYLAAVEFTSTEIGYAVGANGNTGVIIKTTDGGLNWEVQTGNFCPFYNDIVFIDDNLGYVTGGNGAILKTTNGGETWSEQESGVSGNLRSVHFTDENTGYVGEYGRILSTTDGGETWSQLTIFQSYNINSIDFTDALTGYAVGQQGVILQTTDAGASWQFQQSQTTDELRSVHFTDINNGYATGDNGVMLKTTDAGLNWEPFSSTEYYAELNDATFPDACSGYAVGRQGAVFKTTNGGGNWNPLSSGVTTHLNATYFTSNSSGVAVGEDGLILQTTNGGTDWTSPASGLTQDLNAVHFTNAETGYAAGASGKIIKTTDGGATWTELTSGVSNTLNGIHFFDDNLGFAVGTGGRVIRTEDAGETWQILWSGTTLTLRAVHAASADVAYISGVSGHIRKTVNGGSNWEQLTNNINNVVSSIAFIDENTGYAAGYNDNDYGKIYKTETGGETWELETISWEHSLHSVKFADASTVFAVGMNGAILKTVIDADTPVTEELLLCDGEELALNTNTIEGAAYTWTGPNGFISSEQTPMVSSSATEMMSGMYSVSASVNECTSLTQNILVSVNPIPNAPVILESETLCTGQELSLTLTEEEGIFYSWTGPSDFSSEEASPLVSNSATLEMSGSYEVTASINGCESNSIATQIQINPTPTAPEITAVNSLCEGDALSLEATADDGVQIDWTGPNGFTANEAAPLVSSEASLEMSGSYEVTASLDGCESNSIATQVQINPTPTSPEITSVNPICEGDELSLEATAEDGVLFNWTGPNGFRSSEQNPQVSSSSTSTMSASYALTVVLGDCASETTEVTVTVNTIPDTPVADNNGPVLEGEALSLSASDVSGAEYSWTGPNGFTSNEQNPTVSENSAVAMAGVYEVTATVNGCASESGSTTVVVDINSSIQERPLEQNIRLYPNPVSDVFMVNLKELNHATMELYNTQGQVVLTRHLETGVNSFDFNFLSAGVYSLRISSVDWIETHQIIKE